jgi:Mg2+ and Co2+ transporter CorA
MKNCTTEKAPVFQHPVSAKVNADNALPATSSKISEKAMEYLDVKLDSHREIIMRDRLTGEFIDRDKSTETTIEIMVEITIRGLRQSFLVVGRIEDKKYDREKLAAQLRAAALEWLPQRRIFDLFRRTEIDLKADSSETVETSATIEIAQTTADFFEDQAKIGNEASSYLKDILEEMQEMIQSPNEYRHQLQRGIWFLESCLRVSGNSFMHGWCSEKLSRMRSGLTDLLTVC